MKTLSRPLRAARMLDIVREIDLAASKREAETRFLLHITGDPALAAQLATELSRTPGRSGVHPYLSTAAQVPDAVVRVAIQRGNGAPVTAQPSTLTICVTGGAFPEVGAELPRPGEAARVVIPELSPEVVRDTLVPALLKVVPADLHLALARQLSIFQSAVIRGLIDDTTRTNALYAAGTGVAEIVPVLNLPLNVADTLILTKNQLLMAYKIALAAGREGKPQELMMEVVGVLGGGLLFRQVARGLVGLIPVWGIIPKVAVAYAGTAIIGAAASMWALENRVPSAADLRDLYRESLTRGRTLAQRLLPQRKNQKALPEAGQRQPLQLEPPQNGPDDERKLN